MNTTAYKIS